MITNFAKVLCRYSGITPYFVKECIFEIKLCIVRTYNVLPFFKRKVASVQSLPQINLNFGCGQTTYNSWVNVDCFFGNHVDLVMDLRRNVPLISETVDNCYSEHFLEHLYPEEGLAHLKEVYRILKLGGVYRLALPDAIKFARKYIENDLDFFKKAHPWVDRPIEALLAIYSFGGAHKNIFDFAQIEYMAREAGFKECQASTAGNSPSEILRIDNMEPQRVLESFYVELKK